MQPKHVLLIRMASFQFIAIVIVLMAEINILSLQIQIVDYLRSYGKRTKTCETISKQDNLYAFGAEI